MNTSRKESSDLLQNGLNDRKQSSFRRATNTSPQLQSPGQNGPMEKVSGFFKRNSRSVSSFRRRGTVIDFSPAANSFSSLLQEREIKAAFDFFDVSKTGKITLKNLQDRIRAFHPNKKSLPKGELKFLMGGKPHLTYADLKQMIEDGSTISGFDPMEEAFKLYDPNNTGFIDMDVLRKVFSELGHGEITEEDTKLLIEAADYDGDGKINLNDFQNMTKLLDVSRFGVM
uniref:EF-hand domain-containing protein n=1 Tax=Aplanochytrium stocchinoi TaxID=215587 RepID=A0A7S3PK49_9STRA|mmetsp:Transcript_7813/g.10203  ORF Transcript_7813/g.10203 Transcript_7813/m.10203 type:complete len:228 (-) Transcript_7813:443-1126(-)